MTIYDPTDEYEQESIFDAIKKAASFDQATLDSFDNTQDAVDGNAELIQSRGMKAEDTDGAMQAVDEWRRKAISRLSAADDGTPKTIWLNGQLEAHETVMDMIEDGERLRSVKSRAAARSNKYDRKRQKAATEKEDAHYHGLSQGYEQAVEAVSPFAK